MTTQDRISELVALCKGSVTIEFNDHTTDYAPLEEYIYADRFKHLSDEERAAIIKAGQLIDIQAYPKTPIGFVYVVGHDLDAVLDEAIEAARDY